MSAHGELLRERKAVSTAQGSFERAWGLTSGRFLVDAMIERPEIWIDIGLPPNAHNGKQIRRSSTVAAGQTTTGKIRIWCREVNMLRNGVASFERLCVRRRGFERFVWD